MLKGFKTYLKESTFNKGHAYEFVLAAAMVSRFTDRYDDGSPEELTQASVEHVMQEYFKGNTLWNVAEGDDKIDVVEFDGAGLPKDVLEFLRDNKFRKTKDVVDMINTAIRAVKASGTLTKLSMDVITNGKPDTIAVVCGGTEGQMKTKSDVNVFINNKEQRAAGFSVKYGGTKQAGQFSSPDQVKNLTNGFASFGMDIKSLSKLANIKTAADSLVGVYSTREDAVIEEDKAKMFGAVLDLYNEISKKFDSNWLKKGRNAENIMSGLLKANVGKETDVDVIRSDVSFDKKTFSAISRGLDSSAKNGNANWIVDGSRSNPTISLYADGTKLFDVRFRYDADKKSGGYKARFRLLVEVGKNLMSFAQRHS